MKGGWSCWSISEVPHFLRRRQVKHYHEKDAITQGSGGQPEEQYGGKTALSLPVLPGQAELDREAENNKQRKAEDGGGGDICKGG